MIGRVLDGRYRIGPRIARGGMATVYEATDLRLDRVCAVKVMHAGLGDDDDFAARFVREARHAARLSHPNVVAVFDQGEDGDAVFLAMEYVPGHTLRDVIRKEAPMAPGKALGLLDPVLSALAAAHAAGMIHRDVKPENVLIADDGRIKVADFGLARAVSAETQHTATGGVLIGTVSYLAPELVVDGRADARSDVYAAGVLLYEMLTGCKPHQGESPIQVAYKHVHEDVPPRSLEVPGVPAAVGALVARATARDRDLRPADARVLLHQVRRVRAALDHGVVDDPELTADLAPTLAVSRTDFDDLPEAAVLPEQVTVVGAGPLSTDTSILDPAPARRMASRDLVPAGPPARPPARPRRPATPVRQRRRGRGPVLLLVVLLLAVGAGLAGWWFGTGRYTSTPGVINLPVAQARAEVQRAGLTFEVGGRAYSETVKAGSVISTDPEPGSRILAGDPVVATVSRGPERYQVPALRGMSVEQAKAALAEEHLELGDTTERYSERLAAGMVLGSDPAPEVEVRPGTVVDLVVSKGQRPIDVPDLTGEPADEARQALRKLKLKAELTRAHDDEVPAGRVVSQDPSTGTLFRGDTVRLVVSKGPVMVTVPDGLTGMGVEDAKAALEAAGLEVATEHSSLYIGVGYVVSVDPGEGTRVPRGSTVVLSLV
jgi:serine/threonine-protein kinase